MLAASLATAAPLGLSLLFVEEKHVITSVKEGGQASKANIVSGMQVVEVNGKSTDSMTHEALVATLSASSTDVLEIKCGEPSKSWQQREQYKKKQQAEESLKIKVLPFLLLTFFWIFAAMCYTQRDSVFECANMKGVYLQMEPYMAAGFIGANFISIYAMVGNLKSPVDKQKTA